ncbi:hypothetical protein EMMF5_002536 [Cystobasidiomycetes sp. EMM_F5]
MVESLFDLTGAKHFYDFAYIGAHIDNSQTGGTVPDTKQQIANYSSQIDAGNLNLGHGRTLDVGINSVLAIWYDEDKTQDVQGAFARISQAVESAAKQITELRSLNHGRRKHDLLMLPIPPLEVVPNPIFAVNGNATRLRLLGQLTQRYNDGIQQIYQSLKTQEKARESRVYTYDIVGLWRDVSHLPGKTGERPKYGTGRMPGLGSKAQGRHSKGKGSYVKEVEKMRYFVAPKGWLDEEGQLAVLRTSPLKPYVFRASAPVPQDWPVAADKPEKDMRSKRGGIYGPKGFDGNYYLQLAELRRSSQ